MNLKHFLTGWKTMVDKPVVVEPVKFDRKMLDKTFNDLQSAVLSTTQLASNISVSLEEKLKLSEQKLTTVLNALIDGVVLTDDKGIVLDWNQGAERIFGYTKLDMVGKNISYIAGPSHEMYMANFILKLATLHPDSVAVNHIRTVKCLHKTGKTLDLEISVNTLPLANIEDCDVKYLAIIRDVTEKNKLNKESVDRQVMLDTIISSTEDIIIVKDAIGRWKLLNDAGKTVYKFENEEDYLNCTDDEIAYKFPHFAKALAQCAVTDNIAWAAGKSTRSEEILKDDSGKNMYFDVIKTPTFDDKHHRHELIIIGRNITLLKEKRASISIAHTALNASTDMVCITDHEGKVVFANRKLIQTYKFTDYVGIIGKRMSIIRHPDTPDSLYKELWATIKSGNIFQSTFQNRDLEGCDITIFTTIIPIVDKELKTPYFICIQKVV
jgi:PAS domain S-box-containing protein